MCITHGGQLPVVKKRAALRRALRQMALDRRAQLARDRARIDAEERFLDQVDGSPSVRRLLEEDQ